MKKFISFISLLICTAAPLRAEEKLSIVSTLTTFADMAEAVAGSHAEVKSIASAFFNPHFIEPRPTDVLKVKHADLFIHAGLDLELWRYPLVDAAGNADVRPGGSRELDLSQGVTLLEIPSTAQTRAAGDIHLFGNPHYWQDPANARVMVQHIADKLSEVDPAHAADYRSNSAAWISKLDSKIEQWKKIQAALSNRELLAYHNEWPYLMKFAGARTEQFLEPKPGIPPTPRQLSFLREYVKSKNIKGIIQASFYPRESSDALAKETGAKVLLLCQNVKETAACDNYISMLDYNLNELARESL